MSVSLRVNKLERWYDEAAGNVFKEHGIHGKFDISQVKTIFERREDCTRFKELGGDEYFVPLVEAELKKVVFIYKLKGDDV